MVWGLARMAGLFFGGGGPGMRSRALVPGVAPHGDVLPVLCDFWGTCRQFEGCSVERTLVTWLWSGLGIACLGLRQTEWVTETSL